jgi:hypothetical protein
MRRPDLLRTRHEWINSLAAECDALAGMRLDTTIENACLPPEAIALANCSAHCDLIRRSVNKLTNPPQSKGHVRELVADLVQRKTYGAFAELAAYEWLARCNVLIEPQVRMTASDVLAAKRKIPEKAHMAIPTEAIKATPRVPSLPPENQRLSRFCRRRNSGSREFRAGGPGFQGPVDMSLLHVRGSYSHRRLGGWQGDGLCDDCGLLFGELVTIRRTSSIDSNSLRCKHPSAAATLSPARTKKEDGDRPTSGRKASVITFALPRLATPNRTQNDHASRSPVKFRSR